jgi:hypothetical protein
MPASKIGKFFYYGFGIKDVILKSVDFIGNIWGRRSEKGPLV